MTNFSLPATRRIVTGIDSDGFSTIIEDGTGGNILTVEARPGFRNHNVWRTIRSPAPVAAADDVVMHQGVMPPAGGTILRVIDFPPMPIDAEERARQAAASLNALFKDADHDSGNPQPGMHTTPSVDYAIVLAGRVTAILDRAETEMAAGDIMIQRGTRHAWENRSGQPARVAFILIDGQIHEA
jgi:hypothetical protein